MNLPVEIIAALILAGIAVLVELPTGKIPNWLTMSGIAIGLVFAASRQQFTGIATALFVVGLPSLVAFAKQWMAGGTAKLLMATAAVGGLSLGIITLVGIGVLIVVMHTVSRLTDPQPNHPSDQPSPGHGLRFPTSPLIFAISIIYAIVWSMSHTST